METEEVLSRLWRYYNDRLQTLRRREKDNPAQNGWGYAIYMTSAARWEGAMMAIERAARNLNIRLEKEHPNDEKDEERKEEIDG